MSKPIFTLMLLTLLPLTFSATAHQSTKPVTPKTSETKTFDTGNGCVIRLADPFHGHVAGSASGGGLPNLGGYWTDKPPIKTWVEDFRLPFECFDVTPYTTHRFINEMYLGQYDQDKKKWVAYFFSKEDRDASESVTRLYQIKTNNADGFARTTDDTIGDPVTQRRKLTYCLLHGSKAICGDTDVMMLEDPKGNLLPYALKILRSIEFVDPPPASSNTAQPAPLPAKASTQ